MIAYLGTQPAILRRWKRYYGNGADKKAFSIRILCADDNDTGGYEAVYGSKEGKLASL